MSGTNNNHFNFIIKLVLLKYLKELARVSSRLGIFLNNNVSAIQAKVGNNEIDECFKEIITILNNMKGIDIYFYLLIIIFIITKYMIYNQ